MKKFFLIGILMFFFLPIFSQDYIKVSSFDDLPQRYVKTIRYNTVLYEEHSVVSNNLLIIPQWNTVLESKEQHSGWHKVNYNGTEGWLFGMSIYEVNKDGVRLIYDKSNNNNNKQTHEGVSDNYQKENMPELMIVESSVKFVAEDGSTQLNAEDASKITFTIKNTGKGDANNLTVYVSLSQYISGIVFNKTKNIGNLSAGSSKNIEISVTGNENLNTGITEFKIYVKDNANNSSEFQFLEVKTNAYIPPELVLQVDKIEETISNELETVTNQMRENETITEAVETNVNVEVKEEINEEGVSEMNLKVTYEYEVQTSKHELIKLD